jgi:TRAP-type uncharacterized transport system substrate-binding protein
MRSLFGKVLLFLILSTGVVHAGSATIATQTEGLAGILEPTVVLECDHWLHAHKDTPDSKVTAILESLLKGRDTLTSFSRDFRSFDPTLMHDDIGVPFHPAAEAFYVSHKSLLK